MLKIKQILHVSDKVFAHNNDLDDAGETIEGGVWI